MVGGETFDVIRHISSVVLQLKILQKIIRKRGLVSIYIPLPLFREIFALRSRQFRGFFIREYYVGTDARLLTHST